MGAAEKREISSWPSPKKQEFKIARPCSIPKKKVVGPQKTKISTPENQDFKIWRTHFFPHAGLRPASHLVASI